MIAWLKYIPVLEALVVLVRSLLFSVRLENIFFWIIDISSELLQSSIAAIVGNTYCGYIHWWWRYYLVLLLKASFVRN